MRRLKLIQLMGTISVLLVVSLGVTWQFRLRPLRQLTVQQTSVPTIFVAGDYARAFSTNGFVHRLNANHLMTRAMIVNVDTDGQLRIQKIAPLKNNPTIQVVFQDNHHPQKQARQLRHVLSVLNTRYHVTRFNAVGHSSGGNIIFDALTTPTSLSLPRINKFVTIGSTYPGVTTAIDRLPKKLPILNVAGQIWAFNGDGEVNLKQVLAFSTLLRQHGWQPQTSVIHGSPLTAQHSMLHINPTVDVLIAQFLYGH